MRTSMTRAGFGVACQYRADLSSSKVHYRLTRALLVSHIMVKSGLQGLQLVLVRTNMLARPIIIHDNVR